MILKRATEQEVQQHRDRMKCLRIEEKIKSRRDRMDQMSDEIDEFRYRQVMTQYLFEKKCRRLSQSTRQQIAASFTVNAEEVVDHGFYSHYRTRHMYNELKPLGLKKDEIDEMILVYMFRQPDERKRFQAHITSGSVERTPDFFRLRPNPKMKKISTIDLGKRILTYRDDMPIFYTGITNALVPLSRQKPEDKKEILDILENAKNLARSGDTNSAVKQITDGLTPYFFKEARPFLDKKKENGNDIALYASFYARHEKFFRIRKWVHGFAWLFLAQPEYEQINLTKDFARRGRKIKDQTPCPLPDLQHQR